MLDSHDGRVSDVTTVGATTVHPSEERDGLAHRMGHAGVGTVLVTTSAGRVLGSFVADDATMRERRRR